MFVPLGEGVDTDGATYARRPGELTPPASVELTSSRNPSPKSPSPVEVRAHVVHIHAHGRVPVVEVVGLPDGDTPVTQVVGVVVPPVGFDEVLFVLLTIGKSGATGSPLRRLAIDLALAFLVPVYRYFSLNIIELILVISARRS